MEEEATTESVEEDVDTQNATNGKKTQGEEAMETPEIQEEAESNAMETGNIGEEKDDASKSIVMEVDSNVDEIRRIEEVEINETTHVTNIAKDVLSNNDQEGNHPKENENTMEEEEEESVIADASTAMEIAETSEVENVVKEFVNTVDDAVDREDQEKAVSDNGDSSELGENENKGASVEEAILVRQDTVFVNSDNNINDASMSADADTDVDPIASPQYNELNEPEIILADNDDDDVIEAGNKDDEIVASNTDDEIVAISNDDEKYIITKSNLQESRVCMVCSESKNPSYAFTNKLDSFICSEECFDKFKKENDGKYIIQGIRVKTFDMVTATNFSTELNEKCKTCSSIVTSSAISLASLTFCTVDCLKSFYKINCGQCIVCKTDVAETLIGKFWLRFGLKFKAFCSYYCYTKFKPKNNCNYCNAELEANNNLKYCDDLCSAGYMKVEKFKRCSVCHNDKRAVIEFVNDSGSHYFCSEPCFVAYTFVNKTDMKECEICHRYVVENTMLANSILNQLCTRYICSEKCRSVYILMNTSRVKCQICETKKNNFDCIKKKNSYYCSLYCFERLFIIKKDCENCKEFAQVEIREQQLNFCSLLCYNTYKHNDGSTWKSHRLLKAEYINYNDNGTLNKIPFQQMVYTKPPEMVKQRNVSTMVRPNQVSIGITCKPKESTKSVQTEENPVKNLVVPIPVPIHVPLAMHMGVDYVPMPFPVPIPVPVPIFIPTARNSVKGIMKEMKRIKNNLPADPLEAELLMMAEMVAEDTKKNDSNSSDDDDNGPEAFAEQPQQHQQQQPALPAPSSSNFPEDVIQMALKMADDFEEPVDLEGEVSVSTIRPAPSDPQPSTSGQSFERPNKKRGRPKSGKRSCVETTTTTPNVASVTAASAQTPKPDANMCLKYTFGVNAWKQWVSMKNNELEKLPKRPKLIKQDILQLTADELNYSLCLFVKEVRKPNGSEYAPDTIYYLCLGIQQYLYENNRIDNIFCDYLYKKFTDTLNEVCQKFTLLYNESQYIVTRVEEEHLWESKQLGAHSPLVLLNTLMFFNTKHFSLITVEEHLHLSFSHIMKHWKRNPNHPGSRNVLLRFYPPQSFQADNKKRKMYEQQENEENPIRCPVKLYEFYLSKCPESVKTRNDVFYLSPERSCVPDSPLWYSTMGLDQKSMEKMLNRVKVVKEINVALLSN